MTDTAPESHPNPAESEDGAEIDSSTVEDPPDGSSEEHADPDTSPADSPDPAAPSADELAEPFTPDELAEVLATVDDPQDPLVVAGLAGTLYDPTYTGPGAEEAPRGDA